MPSMIDRGHDFSPFDAFCILHSSFLFFFAYQFVAPTGFERGGKLFGFGLDSDESFAGRFEDVEGSISIDREFGEPLFIYCISASGAQRPLTVFNNGGTLAAPGLEEYLESESALPEDFPESGMINLPHFDNLLYKGPEIEDLDTEALKTAVRDPVSWEGSNDIRYGLTSGANGSLVSLLWTAVVVAVVATASASL
jgi:hypothetical protein